VRPATGNEGVADVPPSVTLAAAWLAAGGADETQAVVPQVRRAHGLSLKEAIEAIRAAQQLRGAGQCVPR
jgi:hypothetical protein